MLLILAYRLWQSQHASALPAALAIEVFHNFTLAHDDIMDGADLRRGKHSLHVKRNTNTAILAGDVMLIKSYELLLSACSDQLAASVIQLMTKTALQICEGQQLDMDFEELEAVTLAEYLEMNTAKTAVLLGAALQIGAMLGGASEEHSHTLFAAGVCLGQAFQIQDDYLDAYGDEELIGKRRGADIINAKKTYLFAATAESLQSHRRRRFLETYQQKFDNPEVKIQKIMQYFDEADIARRSVQHFEQLYKEGTGLINELPVSSVGKVLLSDFVTGLMKRTL